LSNAAARRASRHGSFKIEARVETPSATTRTVRRPDEIAEVRPTSATQHSTSATAGLLAESDTDLVEVA
jgi:hypothetical protein